MAPWLLGAPAEACLQMHENAVTYPLSRVPQQHNGLNYQGACQAACPFVLRPREAVWGPLKTRTGHLTAFSGLGGAGSDMSTYLILGNF